MIAKCKPNTLKNFNPRYKSLVIKIRNFKLEIECYRPFKIYEYNCRK